LGPAELLPTEAADTLLATPESESDREGACWVVANSVARGLADLMDQAGPAYVRREGSGEPLQSVDLVYELPSGPGRLAFEPVLPHTYDPDYCWASNPC
jgi:hypothetical protein